MSCVSLRSEAEGTSAAVSLRPPCHHGNRPGVSSGGAWAPFPVDTHHCYGPAWLLILLFRAKSVKLAEISS